jgi:hypothetical protein
MVLHVSLKLKNESEKKERLCSWCVWLAFQATLHRYLLKHALRLIFADTNYWICPGEQERFHHKAVAISVNISPINTAKGVILNNNLLMKGANCRPGCLWCFGIGRLLYAYYLVG